MQTIGMRIHVLILILTIGSLACSGQVVPYRYGIVDFTAASAKDTLFVLPVSWVELDSVKVSRNTELLGEYTDWRIVDPGNRIWLYRPLRMGDTLHVDFAYRPVPLYRAYLRRSLREIVKYSVADSITDSSRIAAFQMKTEGDDSWSRLYKSGSLIRSIQVGTGQDLQLESALNLQIQGRIGKNIDVVAALTDQTTPIQPEGTTEALSELEKIYVSIRTPRFATTLGDYALDLPGGQYDGYGRKLTGILAQAKISPAQITAAGAVSRSQFYSNSLAGQEENQGPYPLHSRDGRTGLVIIAGSESVWLNGEKLRRGEGNDYTVDYSSGEITFTSRRIITSDSRIVVDFEYATENYERFYGAGRSEFSFGGDRIGGTITWITESDDRTRPIGLGLQNEDRAVLSAAGDRADSAVVFTADSIGINGGDYIRRDTVFATVAYTIFEYSPHHSDSVDKPTGQWRVVFDDFGAGRGDYEAAADEYGFTYFRWVGPQRGRYRSYRRLPLPENHSLADVRVHGTPLQGWQIRGEFATSQRDLNTYSSTGDGDNNGSAISLATDFTRESLDLGVVKPYKIELSGQLRRRDCRFSELSRVSEIEFQREWDAVGNSGMEETIRETGIRISPLKELAVFGGYGDIQRGNSFSSRRRTAGAAINPLPRWNLQINHTALQSDDSATTRRGNWIRQDARLSGTSGRFSPRLGLERERKRDRIADAYTGFRFLDWWSGLGVTLPGNLALDSEYRRRADDEVRSDGGYQPSSEAYTAGGEITWSPPEWGRSQLRFTHRKKDYSAPDSADASTDLGRFETVLTSPNRVWEVNAAYEVAKSQSQSQILVAVEVPEGTGNYRREGSQYVPDDQGNFILVPRYTGAYEPASNLSLTSLFAVRPDELPPDRADGLVRAVSLESELTLEEQTRRALNARILLMDQSQFRGDSTLSGSLSFRQDLNLWRLSQIFSLRFRYREAHSLQNQYLNGGQSRHLREGQIRVRARYLPAWRGETEIKLSRETQSYQALSVPDRDVDRLELTQVNTILLSRQWEIGADLGWTDAQDDRTSTNSGLYELKPHAAYTVLARGRFDAEAAWTHARSNRTVIPYELGRGSNRGENYRWSLRGTYQFGQSFSGSLNYSARKDAGEKTFHTGRLEVRASL